MSTTATLATSKPKPDRRLYVAAQTLKQASDATRLSILLMLAERERNVTQIHAEFPAISQPAVSHHLALLRAGNVVVSRIAGKERIYSLTDAGRCLVGAIERLTSSI